MNKKGFTVVELMTTFALIAVIAVLLIKLTITLKEIYVNGDIKTALLTKQGTITDKIYKDLNEKKLISLTSCDVNCIEFSFENEEKTKKLLINKDKKILTYGNYSIKLGDGGYFGTVEISNYDSDIGYIFNLNIPIYHKLVKGNFGININHQLENLSFDNSINFDVVEENKKIICKRAVTLHTEECTQTDKNNYCGAAGYTKTGNKGTTTITYGNYGIKGILKSGDAFDCDVNGDGTYDAETERFYYLTDLNKDVVSLIYYNNTLKGVKNINGASSYDVSGENWHGPVTAITNLPTIEQWKNVNLKNTNRQILNQIGGTTSSGGTLPTKFSYNGYAARLLTYQEVNNACGLTIGDKKMGEIENCVFLLENTKFATATDNSIYGYWLENPNNEDSEYAWAAYSDTRRFNIYYKVDNKANLGIRPVIEISKENIAY